MAKTAIKPVELSKGERVVALADLREVPKGTEGKVAIVNGFTWKRYWIRFDNGVALGSVNRDKLARPEEWERIQNGGTAAGPVVATAAAGEAAESGGAGEAVMSPNGTAIPALLIERSKRARERLGK